MTTIERAARLQIIRAAFPPGTCGWCQRNARAFAHAMCPGCWRALTPAMRAEYLAIDGPADADITFARARWIVAHCPPPLLELRRPPRRRRPRGGPPR